jgi:hypothetical protein
MNKSSFSKFDELKVLSSEMDPGEIRFFLLALIKGRGAEVFGKIHPSPIL